MDIRPEYRKKSIRSYVVRAGRMTDGQRNAFENSWAQYGLKLTDGAIDTDDVFGRSGTKVLEIGFGMGDSLLQMAAAEPDTDFIGIEDSPTRGWHLDEWRHRTEYREPAGLSG